MSETPEAKNKILMRIDALCRERSWSHYQLAIASGISASTINNMFRRNSYPSFPLLSKICDGFQIQISDFFRDPARIDYELNSCETHLISCFRSLSDHDKDIFLAYLHGLLHLSDNDMKENGTKTE